MAVKGAKKSISGGTKRNCVKKIPKKVKDKLTADFVEMFEAAGATFVNCKKCDEKRGKAQ